MPADILIKIVEAERAFHAKNFRRAKTIYLSPDEVQELRKITRQAMVPGQCDQWEGENVCGLKIASNPWEADIYLTPPSIFKFY